MPVRRLINATRFTKGFALAAACALATSAAEAQNAPSVQSLLTEGYAVVGVIPSTAGPGVFLVKGDKMMACFVAETPNSPAISTQYCKPVR